ncbi:hypothetical protein ACFY2K_26130 [Kitasatospora sp. NPDC001309]|uniref:hypothetical protein n=1 Tax=Kitasatospora sp. NPDC001309 TaxID=3364013 RepID=UPI003688C16C
MSDYLYGPDETIRINGKEVPRFIIHEDGSQTWNLDAETAGAINRAVEAQIVRFLGNIVDGLARLGGR